MMYRNRCLSSVPSQSTGPACCFPTNMPADGHDEWERLGSGFLPDECWDVFVLDEHNVEPEPEEGDFWGVIDDELRDDGERIRP